MRCDDHIWSFSQYNPFFLWWAERKVKDLKVNWSSWVKSTEIPKHKEGHDWEKRWKLRRHMASVEHNNRHFTFFFNILMTSIVTVSHQTIKQNHTTSYVFIENPNNFLWGDMVWSDAGKCWEKILYPFLTLKGSTLPHPGNSNIYSTHCFIKQYPCWLIGCIVSFKVNLVGQLT